MITREEELDLIIRAKAGDREAAGELVEAHERYFYKLARRSGAAEHELEDLVQEAKIKALLAIEDFEPERGFRFLTLAGRRAQSKINLVSTEQRTAIRTPISAWTGSEEFRESAKRARRTSSVHDKFGDDGQRMDVLSDSRIENPVAVAARNDDAARLRDAFRFLPQVWQRILEMRSNGSTLEEVGNEIGVSRERVRQLETKAMAKLRFVLKKHPDELVEDEPEDDHDPRKSLWQNLDLDRRVREQRRMAIDADRWFLPWSDDELYLLRDLHARHQVKAIATKLGRGYTSVVAKATSIGLRKVRPWSPTEEQFIRENRHMGWIWVASQLPGRNVIQVRSQAVRIGAQNKEFFVDQERLRSFHAQGMTSTQIGIALGVSDECVRRNLQQMGLPYNKRDENVRLRKLNRKLTKKYGTDKLCEVKGKVFVERAALLGWPSLPYREALLAESMRRISRPADRDELAEERCKIAQERGWKLSRSWQSVLGTAKRLCDMGIATSTGSGNRRRFYSLLTNSTEKE